MKTKNKKLKQKTYDLLCPHCKRTVATQGGFICLGHGNWECTACETQFNHETQEVLEAGE